MFKGVSFAVLISADLYSLYICKIRSPSHPFFLCIQQPVDFFLTPFDDSCSF
jgi:hypothetical protein